MYERPPIARDHPCVGIPTTHRLHAGRGCGSLWRCRKHHEARHAPRWLASKPSRSARQIHHYYRKPVLTYKTAATFLGAIATAAMMASTSQAQTVGLHLASVHEAQGMNNTNPGAYYRSATGWTAGAYRNSVRRNSVYAGKTWETSTWHGLSAAVTAGGVTGYGGKVTVLLVPSVAYSGGLGAVRIGIVPRPPVHGGQGALHLMVERSL
jgi:hypothetical protein